MRIPFSLLFALVLSLDTFAAPVPNADVGNEFALEVRKTKVAPKKAAVKAKAPPKPKLTAKKPPVAKPKPLPKKAAAKPVKPVAKPPVKVAKPVAKPPVKPAAKKVTATAKKPATKAPAAKPPVKAVKPAAKPPVKPAAKKKVTAPAKKPVAKTPAAKPPVKAGKTAVPAKKPVAKPPVKPVAKGKTAVNATTPGTGPTSCAVRKKPAVKAPAPAKALTGRAKSKKKPITACGVEIRNDNVAKLCEERSTTFLFTSGALDPKTLTRRVNSDSEEEDSDDSEDEESDDSQDGDFSPSPEPETRSQCDHVLELQVLKKTLESTGGLCDTLKAMIASPNSGLTTDDIPTLMAPIKAAINAKNNLFFLDKKLNQVKRDEVTASLKGQTPVTSVSADLNKQRIAVNGYLTDTSVNGPSITLAKKLDTLVAAMLTKAEDQGLAHIKSCAVTTAAADEKALKAAKAKLKTPPTVASAWKNVLSHVAQQAAVS
ncbi:hypothetical protein DFH09DRAFT_1278163 [Mycena vulgaris]|nr:hypothetical protein DFH09DRAFT_1373116 [Mycena vulgaris]KAJ6568084.1 hypothetical protein DFH09DRAFT_1278163 [Mycena vulgaris]